LKVEGNNLQGTHIQLIDIFISFRYMMGSTHDAVLWYAARDSFMGQNECGLDVRGAYRIARRCNSPDAVWLTKVLRVVFTMRGHVSTLLGEVLTACWENDEKRALCFSGAFPLFKDAHVDRLHRSADLGYPYAQALMAGRTKGAERFSWAQSCCSRREARDALSCCMLSVWKGM
jgi:hypothetical protein